MKLIKNHNKVSGKRINSTIRKSSLVGKYVPIKENVKLIDDHHVSLLHIPDNPLGVGETGEVEISHIKDVFSDREEMDVTLNEDKLTIRLGKNEYWFLVTDNLYEPKIPEITDFTTDFELDPSELAKFVKGHKDGFVRLVATYDKTGKKTVFAFLYEPVREYGNIYPVDKLVGGLDLHTTWNGAEFSTAYPSERLMKMDAFGTNAKIQTRTNYPFVMSGWDAGVEYQYLVAPQINEGNVDFTEREKNWIASHNKKLFKWWNRKS